MTTFDETFPFLEALDGMERREQQAVFVIQVLELLDEGLSLPSATRSALAELNDDADYFVEYDEDNEEN